MRHFRQPAAYYPRQSKGHFAMKSAMMFFMRLALWRQWMHAPLPRLVLLEEQYRCIANLAI